MNLIEPERLERLADALDAGLSCRAAARAAGVHRETAGRYRRLFRSSRRRGALVACRLSKAVSARCESEAAARGISLGELVARILENVAQDNIFGAVLDA